MTQGTWSKTALVIEAARESIEDIRYSTRYADLSISQKAIEKDKALKHLSELLTAAL